MMGWVSLPPMFCAASETAADLANAALFRNTVPPHRLEDITSAHDCWGSPPLPNLGPQALLSPMTVKSSARGSPPLNAVGLVAPLSPMADALTSGAPWPLQQPEDRALLLQHWGPIAHVDVFVDDFTGIAQGSQWQCQNAHRCIMHAVDKVFSQPDEVTAQCKEAISEKKLKKGGGSQQKEILGWMLDTSCGTLELTEHH
jgi:hypothetical protein